MLQLTDIKTFEKLKKCYLTLLQKDESLLVRQMMISSLHAVAEILGLEEACKNLQEAVTVLLRDKDPQIMLSVANRIDLILKNVIPVPPERSDEEEDNGGGNTQTEKEEEVRYLPALRRVCGRS